MVRFMEGTMRIFHVSEEGDINVFNPRTPSRIDLDNNINLVWAIREERLVNFLTPRDCPRVTFYARGDSKKSDIEKYIGKGNVNAVIAIEHGWFEKVLNTTLYLYEFDTTNFVLQDDIAGYYVSTKAEVPIRVIKVENIFSALFEYNIEFRIVPNLWNIFDDIVASTLGYSMCRMRNAIPRK
jgi:hypothetical protein